MNTPASAEVWQPGPEWEILELLCRGVDVTAQNAELDRLVRVGLRWGELVDHALRHKMLPMLAYAIIEANLGDRLPIRLLEHLYSVLELNRHRRRVWYAELGRVTAALRSNGVDVVARKGAAYEATIYGANGSRWIGDIDVLIRPDDRERAAALLEQVGYECGLFDFRTNLVVPFAREELIKYRLNPDHLPTYTYITGDPLVPIVEVDCATSLTWARSTYRVDIDEVLAEISHHVVDVPPRVSVPRALPVYQFLDTVLHLFREAWFEWWLDKEQDVDLMKFGDVMRLALAYRADLVDGQFRKLVLRHGVAQPVCWVLEHLDRTFGAGLTRELDLQGQVTESFLASAAAAGPEVAVWHADMRVRLYARDRRQLLERAS